MQSRHGATASCSCMHLQVPYSAAGWQFFSNSITLPEQPSRLQCRQAIKPLCISGADAKLHLLDSCQVSQTVC